MSVRVIAWATSERWRVLLLLSSAAFHALNVSSKMNISHAWNTNVFKKKALQFLIPHATRPPLSIMPNAYLCKQNWSFGWDHTHVLVRFHNLHVMVSGYARWTEVECHCWHTFLILAKGSWWFLNSAGSATVSTTSCICCCQKALSSGIDCCCWHCCAAWLA